MIKKVTNQYYCHKIPGNSTTKDYNRFNTRKRCLGFAVTRFHQHCNSFEIPWIETANNSMSSKVYDGLGQKLLMVDFDPFGQRDR